MNVQSHRGMNPFSGCRKEEAIQQIREQVLEVETGQGPTKGQDYGAHTKGDIEFEAGV